MDSTYAMGSTDVYLLGHHQYRTLSLHREGPGFPDGEINENPIF